LPKANGGFVAKTKLTFNVLPVIYKKSNMKKYLLVIFTFLLSFQGITKPLQQSTKHRIIIDTDCAIDDLRAISMLLSRPEITIEAILLSDGTLSPADGLKKISALLDEFNKDSIPVGIGKATNNVHPAWQQFNKQIEWGKETNHLILSKDAVSLLIEKLLASDNKRILLCLGPLTNIAQALEKDRSIKRKVEKIIWYNESLIPLHGFNAKSDTTSAIKVINSGIRFDMISNLKHSDLTFGNEQYKACTNSKTKLAAVLCYVHSQKPVQEKLKEDHFRLADELAAIYLTNAELFDVNPIMQNPLLRMDVNFNETAIKEVMMDMIKGSYTPSENIVFNGFPVQRELFAYDVRQIMDSAMLKFGPEEWKANVMTDEFHGHLGVYSIVGAKMGIRAREWFNVGPDQLEALSYAGIIPPYSCLNDGIQASTGATLGMGTIRVNLEGKTKPEAVFTYKGKSIRICLKDEYNKRVDSDIEEGIVKFGLMDDGYWKLIRRNALKYWIDWDRNKIFEIEPVNPPNP
jgi:inosine-uridine nucleoside N-ribohydrolase/formylmethanofuran dehydrogenase subunit E